MYDLGNALVVIGILFIIFASVWFITALIKKKSKKIPVIIAICSIVLIDLKLFLVV